MSLLDKIAYDNVFAGNIKTKAVIEQHEEKFNKMTTDPTYAQYIMYLKVAKKCVEEIILIKKKEKSSKKPYRAA